MRQRIRSLACFLLPVAVALAACQAGVPQPPTPAPGPKVLPVSGPASEARGKLLYARGVELRTFDPSTGAQQSFLKFPPGAFGGLPAVSPDGALVAYSIYRPGQSRNDPGGADLWVIDADGTNQRLVLAHDEPGSALSDPAWTPDGRSLSFTWRGQQGATRIERVRLDGSERTVVVQDGQSPTASLDGRWLAYLTTEPRTLAPTLWVSEANGANPKRLLGSPEFLMLGSPRLAPDSKRLAFSAVAAAGGTTPPRGAPGGPTSWLEPPVAYAHGVPWDLWLVQVDGSGLQRLTNLDEDSPVAAWSPDGKWLAFSGELGLYLVDPETRQVRRLAEEGAGGGLAWLGR
ncbi:MAG: PD40 domain-containing protein [Chloroflexi bacterium]|nr:PD40 domain-containing protein [Chloroflexota bacterium]